MDNELHTILGYFNLSEKEALLYITALRSGPTTVYELAKSSGLKRPTTYVLSEGLKAKGLLTSAPDRHREILSPISPRQLITGWKGKLEALESIAPELNAYYERTSPAPRISIYEGEKGLDAAYNQILSPHGTGKHELLLLSTISVLERHYSHLFPTWRRTVRDKRNQIRDIVRDEPAGRKYAEDMLALKNPNYRVRISNVEIGETDTFIYTNKIVLFWFTPPFNAVIIESEEMAKTFKALFETAWACAKKISG
ncbi:MAG: hypothetical protein HZA95_01165 [Candidatus Vogelbacteria bacterium]|nr:hypothetical protein [Candidatus Vogelbacteria bacterium]